MSQNTSLFPLAAATLLGFVATTAIFMAPHSAFAADPKGKAKTADTAARATPPGTILDHPLPSAEQSTPQKPAPNSAPQAGDTTCSCPPTKEKLWSRPKFAEVPSASRVVLDETDEIAALESVQFALTEVGDGASYVWHRNNGRLSGLVQPVASFKDAQGQICRHVVVILTSGPASKKTEGIACRLTSGQWKLEG
jgi:hypothetical protein